MDRGVKAGRVNVIIAFFDLVLGIVTEVDAGGAGALEEGEGAGFFAGVGDDSAHGWIEMLCFGSRWYLLSSIQRINVLSV